MSKVTVRTFPREPSLPSTFENAQPLVPVVVKDNEGNSYVGVKVPCIGGNYAYLLFVNSEGACTYTLQPETMRLTDENGTVTIDV